MRLRCPCAVLLFLAVLVAPAALSAQPFELTVPNIMRGPEHVGSGPSFVRWTDDGAWIYFTWKPGGTAWDEDRDLYRVRGRGGEPERLEDEVADSLRLYVAAGDISPDERWKVVSHRGDLWLIERRSLDARRLTDTRERESAPVFSRDGETVYFVRDDNVYALRLETAELRQVTDIRKGSPPEDEEEAEGQRGFLERQQDELFEHIRREAEEEEKREAREEARKATEPEPVYIPEGEEVWRVMVEPGERWALLQAGSRARDAKRTMVPDWVTESGYTEPLNVRSKVGDAQSSTRIGIVDVDSGGVRWLELVPDDVAADTTDPHTDELARASFLGWNEEGTHGLVHATSYDFKDAWLYAVDGATAELTPIVHEHDDAWLGGPCTGCAGWMPDGGHAWFVSERTGHTHLYTLPIAGGEPRQLTSGAWEVHDVAISPDEDRFHLATNEGSPFEQHVWHMGLDGGRRTRITERTGWHEATASPDGRGLAVVHSASNRPPELFVMDNRAGAEMRQITRSPTEEWLAGPWIEPEIIRFRARDGAMVPARIYRPADLGAEPNGAGVLFVHGAGYMQNVDRAWSSYDREYMFHHLLASRGYTVLDIDYRGSAGYGRDWRTAIYRHMGGKDLTDQVDGARYLAAGEGVDPERIGIYGGSYGGFITLMALFTEPESFAAGAALRSVTDWAHYNHWYTSRILNLPHEDEDAYRRSSPIYFAEGLEDPLLIAHGMVDTNVHFSDVVRLAQRLIELGKTGWEMAVYPVEGHGFDEPTSWTDEYRRILALFERHLR